MRHGRRTMNAAGPFSCGVNPTESMCMSLMHGPTWYSVPSRSPRLSLLPSQSVGSKPHCTAIEPPRLKLLLLSATSAADAGDVVSSKMPKPLSSDALHLAGMPCTSDEHAYMRHAACDDETSHDGACMGASGGCMHCERESEWEVRLLPLQAALSSFSASGIASNDPATCACMGVRKGDGISGTAVAVAAAVTAASYEQEGPGCKGALQLCCACWVCCVLVERGDVRRG